MSAKPADRDPFPPAVAPDTPQFCPGTEWAGFARVVEPVLATPYAVLDVAEVIVLKGEFYRLGGKPEEVRSGEKER